METYKSKFTAKEIDNKLEKLSSNIYIFDVEDLTIKISTEGILTEVGDILIPLDIDKINLGDIIKFTQAEGLINYNCLINKTLDYGNGHQYYINFKDIIVNNNNNDGTGKANYFVMIDENINELIGDMKESLYPNTGLEYNKYYFVISKETIDF